MNTKNMENKEGMISQSEVQKISEEGLKIYQEIKHNYGEEDTGKFLAIEIESRDTYLSDTTSGAVESARRVHPDKIFYVVKIGFSVSEVLADLRVQVET